MRKNITIKNNIASFDGSEEKFKLDELIIHITDGVLVGSYRVDYLIQILREYEKLPSKFSIAKRLKSEAKKLFKNAPKNLPHKGINIKE